VSGSRSVSGLSQIDVVVLAGGLGTRIQSVLGDTPKLLAPVGDQTYLDLLLDWLQSFGARRVVLSLGHLADKIIDYVEAHPRADLDIITVTEPEPMGTAGALRFVRNRVTSDVALVMNGDSWIDADLAALCTAQVNGDAAGTLLCVCVPDAGRYGKIDLDVNGRVAAFAEKQKDAGPGLINAGVYAFSTSAWDIIGASKGRSLERDIFAKQPDCLAVFNAGDVPFIDIGTPESLAQAAAFIQAAKSS
jgi:NDP-sugar pyrophosphorylase family protein